MQKTYEDIVEVAKLRIQPYFVDGWEEMDTRLDVKYARLAVTAEDELLRRSLYVQSSVEKSVSLFSIRVTEASGVGSSSSESPCAGAKNAKTRMKRRSNYVRKRTEDLSSGSDDIDTDSVQVKVP